LGSLYSISTRYIDIDDDLETQLEERARLNKMYVGGPQKALKPESHIIKTIFVTPRGNHKQIEVNYTAMQSASGRTQREPGGRCVCCHEIYFSA